jgi:RimJ/RimL family protein N-acetyltransferase
VILYNHHRALMAWASEKLGQNLVQPGQVALGVVREGELVAVALFFDYRWPDIKVTFVSTTPRWFTRAHAREILQYPFIQLKCKRLTAVTEATNQRTRAFLCRFGFRQEGVHPDVFPSGDAISYGLLAKDAARWLAEEEYGKSLTAQPA